LFDVMTAIGYDTETATRCQLTTPILIDTDPGIDDALAILLALGSPEVSVEAITTVAGNVEVDLATANTFRILDVARPWHVARPGRRPLVARGAEAPLAGPLLTAAHVHGEDGLGNLVGLREPDGQPRYPEPSHTLQMLDGANLILETADRFAGRLVVVALGPLTNVALALRRDPRRLAQVARVVVMGGAVGVPGNVTAAAEFNMHVDPEAAAEVFASGLPIELVPLDVTRRVVLTRADLSKALARQGGKTARFIEDFTAHGFDFETQRGDGGMALHDPLAVGVAVDPSLVTLEPLHVAVECAGRLTRGMTVADRRPHRDRPAPTCRAALDVDAPRFLRLFLERVCRASA
jgi:purine nucleosidase/pyrimidine-specific ribonucleoside hydrolase